MLQDEHNEAVNRKRVQCLMQLMGMTALYPQPCTSRPGQGQDLSVFAARGGNRACAPGLGKGYHLYSHGAGLSLSRGCYGLVQSQGILAWQLANAMECDLCVMALEDALAIYGSLEIFNTDQGSQFYQ